MTVERDIEVLRRTALFARVDPVRLEVLAFTAAHRRFETGALVIERGQLLEGAFVVLEGSAVMLGEDGEGRPMASRLDRGDIIGETALLKPVPAKANVRAGEALELMEISRALFARLAEEFPELALGVAAAAADRLEGLSGALRGLLKENKEKEQGRV
ncbi:cyclic nucleotide-binding protein [Tepidicaulis marinus]|uniref:Cyclic nucleotide-binding protein n=1 Tax=Tepidicaulis marinus TaxID=1333998 RepID=A0A081B6L3_9HYPH|nr:cyclic nucleotide-binding domain-containing protein [Tepidicaulis marinus]GAK43681.1 cyclic nucleotide-binding protein [Tepidicaulis marinus]